MEWGHLPDLHSEPEVADSRVDVLPSLETPWRCWHDCSDDRAYSVDGYGAGMGAMRVISTPRPIPWSAIIRWCRYHLVPRDEVPEVMHLVRAMDRVFLERAAIRAADDLRRAFKR